MPKTDPEVMRAHLISLPTPLEAAPRLAQAIGLEAEDLWIKRDDLTGLGGGGNKARKLERTAGAARAHGATALVTSGAAQSNHARLTAAAGARLGMDVVLVLSGTPGDTATGNIALDGLFGARIVWAGETGEAALEDAVADVAEELRAKGGRPEVIPFGGSSVLGAQGYVEAGEELLAQLPGLTSTVVAVGSGGTMAGLVAALGAERVLGVDCGAVPDPEQAVTHLVNGLSGDQQIMRLRLRLDQVGPGYSALTDQVREAMLTAARTEGIVLDPVYTGRAMAGLIAAVREGDVRPGERTVFLHTGGLPGLFGHSEALAQAALLVDAQSGTKDHIYPLRLGVDDSGEVLTLQRAAYVTEAQAHGDLTMPPLTQTLGQLREELTDPRTMAWGIREHGRLVASVRVRLADPATAEIGRLVVAPDRQGNGLGTALLLAAETRLPAGIMVIRLFTGEHSHANLRLYQRLGYRETGRVLAGSYHLVHLAKTRAAALE